MTTLESKDLRMSNPFRERWHSFFLRLYPGLGLLLVFLGPYFFFQCLSFLRNNDYIAGGLSFLGGWALLRAGVDLTRAYLASESYSLEPSDPTD